MHHVVADLHVLENLGHGKRSRPQQPEGAPIGAQEHHARAEHELAMQADHGADVARIPIAEIGEDLVVDGVEFAADLLDLIRGQAGQRALGRIRYRLGGLG